jgi:hypothetical protein
MAYSNLYSKNLSISDMDVIEYCIRQHSTMYGIPIDHNMLIKRFKNTLDHGYVIGSFDTNHNCVGVCTQSFWKKMPVWTFSNAFMLNSPGNRRYDNKCIDTAGSFLEQIATNGEKHGCVEGYASIRDNIKQTRIKQSIKRYYGYNSPVLNRYDLMIVQHIQKKEDIIWDYVLPLIGDIGLTALGPPYNKTLSIYRLSIKPIYRFEGCSLILPRLTLADCQEKV